MTMMTDKQRVALYFARKRHRIANSLSLSGTPVTTATSGVAYAGFTVSANGGVAPYAFSVWGGAFPSGISIDEASGEVSGTPAETGVFPITLAATDAYGTVRLFPDFTITVS